MTSVTKTNDPFNLGSLFDLPFNPEVLTLVDMMSQKTKLIARPILESSLEAGASSSDPLISYMKITLDPGTHILKVALYFKASNASKIQFGDLQDTKDHNILKRVVSRHAELNLPFRESLISYFPKFEQQKAIAFVFRIYDMFKDDEVPVVCPFGLSIVYYVKKTTKFLEKYTQ